MTVVGVARLRSIEWQKFEDVIRIVNVGITDRTARRIGGLVSKAGMSKKVESERLYLNRLDTVRWSMSGSSSLVSSRSVTTGVRRSGRQSLRRRNSGFGPGLVLL